MVFWNREYRTLEEPYTLDLLFLTKSKDSFYKRISVLHLYSFLKYVNVINKLSQWEGLPAATFT